MAEEEDSVTVPAEEESPEPVAEPMARPVRFAPLPEVGETRKDGPLGLLEGVSARVSVELGRTVLPVKEVLSLGPGTVVELDRYSTEPVDILVNGELVARGEVIVIDNDFGVRVTEIVKRIPAK